MLQMSVKQPAKHGSIDPAVSAAEASFIKVVSICPVTFFLLYRSILLCIPVYIIAI